MTDPTATTPNFPPQIEHDLRALTTWQGQPTALWQSALDSAAAKPSPLLSRPKTFRLIATLSAAAILLLAVGFIITPQVRSMSPVSVRKSVGQIAFDAPSSHPPAPPPDIQGLLNINTLSPEHFDKLPLMDGRSEDWAAVSEKKSDVPEPQRPSDLRAPSRHVIRRATLELAVPDAREAFAKVQHLIRPDLGEFIEGSTLTGQANDTRAQLTLRVAASRMDEVLNALRPLGKVDSENATGDDVSAQVVDLDARLRNERQVEIEVLKLLESRGKDAKLSDIIELRDKLSSIRQSIELLQGRRDTLGRQIALASILVIIRPDNAPKPDPKPASLLDAFSDEVSRAWTSGLTTLTQTLAFLIRIAIGGLPWWLLLFALIAIARRAIRRLIPDPAAIPVSA